jgi:hypothetical protein
MLQVAPVGTHLLVSSLLWTFTGFKRLKEKEKNMTTETSNAAPGVKPNQVVATCREGTVVTHHRSAEERNAGINSGEANHVIGFANSGFRTLDEGITLPNVGRWKGVNHLHHWTWDVIARFSGDSNIGKCSLQILSYGYQTLKPTSVGFFLAFSCFFDTLLSTISIHYLYCLWSSTDAL